jgi:SAM-dependent methyltransferase
VTAVDAGLTDEAYWDEYWHTYRLPTEVRRRPGAVYVNSILDVFDRYLPKDPTFSAAELGGAPGQYLAYVRRNLGYRVTSIDYSKIGCQKTIENFRLLGLEGAVIESDIFLDLPTDERFDVVYSLGLIEHFADRVGVVGRHVCLVKPGGYLVLGVPNLRGIYGWFMRRLRPKAYATHEIGAMNIDRWSEFEASFRLQTIFKAYVGGFEPRIFWSREELRLGNLPIATVAICMDVAFHSVLGFLRRFNGPRISGYAMAVYRVPGQLAYSAE